MSVADRIKTQLREQLCLSDREISGTDDIVDNLGADSLDMVEIVMALEDAFKIDITDKEAEGIHTVDDAIRLVEAKI